jgi:NAD(P)-dependent dehydrogenase (short-subunit alcohol dehydrogenase family)
VKNESDVRSTIGEVATVLGGIDALIKNAGEIVVGPLDTMERKDFQDALDIHFWAPFNVIFASLPYLSKSRFARIVNIASFEGRVAVPHLSPYCVSKFALIGLSDALRAELASKNIFVTTVAPGLLRTGSQKNAFFKDNTGRSLPGFPWKRAAHLSPWTLITLLVRFWMRFRNRRPELTITIAARLASIVQASAAECNGRPHEAHYPLVTSNADSTQERDLHWLGKRIDSLSFLLTRIADRATELYNGLGNHPLSR